MKLKLVTLKGVVFNGDLEALSAKTAAGEITVLDHHRPLLSILRPSELRIVSQGREERISIRGGFLEVRPDNEICIIAS